MGNLDLPGTAQPRRVVRHPQTRLNPPKSELTRNLTRSLKTTKVDPSPSPYLLKDRSSLASRKRMELFEKNTCLSGMCVRSSLIARLMVSYIPFPQIHADLSSKDPQNSAQPAAGYLVSIALPDLPWRMEHILRTIYHPRPAPIPP